MSRESDASELYVATFAARSDDHVSWTGMMWARAGRPLTAESVAEGIAGTGPTLSTYFLTPESRGHVAAVDFDTDTGLADAKRVRDALAKRGAPSYVEASRRGAHLWIVCDWQHTGRILRQFLRASLIAAEVTITEKVELRPAQDEIKPDGFGAPLRLPTMPNPKTGLRYPVLDLDGKPIPPRLSDLILAVDTAPRYVVESMAATYRAQPRDLPPDYFPPRSIRQHDESDSASEILATLWGVPDARPGHVSSCPAGWCHSHGDVHKGLSVFPDDQRALCHKPGCDLNNDGRGRGTWELRKMAPGAVATA